MERIALITGGAGDLGLASAAALSASGVTVILADLQLPAAATALERLPGKNHALAFDVSNEAAVIDAFDHIERVYGPISILAHLAGIIDGAGPMNGILVADLAAETWQKVFAINSFGTFLCVREMVRRRRALPVEHARIITFSSLAGQMGGYLSGAAYAASKASIIAFSKNVAREVAPLQMTVNVIAPGAIDSKMNRQAAGVSRDSTAGGAIGVDTIPMRRKGLPAEVGALVAFIASPEASYITGQTLAVNGGSYM